MADNSWGHASAARTAIKESRIEDYLFIGGPRIPARQAAQRVGVTRRTIERYKKYLRETGRLR